jgi:hypothetical protein
MSVSHGRTVEVPDVHNERAASLLSSPFSEHRLHAFRSERHVIKALPG